MQLVIYQVSKQFYDKQMVVHKNYIVMKLEKHSQGADLCQGSSLSHLALSEIALSHSDKESLK